MLKGSLSFNANNAPKTSISVKNAQCRKTNCIYNIPIAQHCEIKFYDAI